MFCLWSLTKAESLSHFEIRLPQAVQYLPKTAHQFPRPLLPTTTEVGVAVEEPWEPLRGSGAISGQNSVEGQDVSEAENTHAVKPLPFSRASLVTTRMPKLK